MLRKAYFRAISSYVWLWDGANLSRRYGVRSMMDSLGALVVIGIFVCWCDVTGAWDDVPRPIRINLPFKVEHYQ